MAYALPFDGDTVAVTSAPLGDPRTFTKFKFVAYGMYWPNSNGTFFAQGGGTDSINELYFNNYNGTLTLILNGESNQIGSFSSVFGSSFSGKLSVEIDYALSTVSVELNDSEVISTSVVIGNEYAGNSNFRMGGRRSTSGGGSGWVAPSGARMGDVEVYVDDILVRNYSQSSTPSGTWADSVSSADAEVQKESGNPKSVNWYEYGVVSASIAVEEPALPNFVYQRDGNNEATITFGVTYSGTPTSLQYRLLDASDLSEVVDWTTFDNSPSGGSSNLSLTVSSGLTEYVVEVATEDTTNSATQDAKWSVGAKVWMGGQSLMEHLSTQDSVSGTSTVYKYEASTGFARASAGAGQQEFGERLVSVLGCIVAVCNTAVGGTCMTEEGAIAQSAPGYYWNNPNGDLWRDSLTALNGFAPDGRVEFACFMQGGSDATGAVDGTIFENDYYEFISRLRGTLTNKDGSSLFLILSSLGRTNYSTDENRQAIREALRRVSESDTLIEQVPVYNLPTSDGTHPTDSGDAELGRTLAQIGTGATAPKLTDINLDGSELTLTFDQNLDPDYSNFSSEGLRVEVSGAPVSIDSFVRESNRTAVMTLASAPNDASDISVFVGWGSGTSNSRLYYPKSDVNSLYAIPVISKNNDFSAAVNQPPVANAGPDQSVAAGATCILEGSNSSDSDGTITSYSWRKVSGPTIALANANQAVASFIAPSESTIQTLVFELTVTDDDGATSTDTVTVTVAAVPDVADPLDPTLSVISIKSKVGIEDDVQSFGVVSLYQYTDNFILCEVVSKSNAALSPDSFSQAEYRIVDNKGTNVVKLGLGTGIKEADGKFLIHINSGILNSSHKGSLKHQFVVWNQAGYKLPPIFGGTVNIIPVLEPTL